MTALTNIVYPFLSVLSYPLHIEVWVIAWMAVMGAGPAFALWRVVSTVGAVILRLADALSR